MGLYSSAQIHVIYRQCLFQTLVKIVNIKELLSVSVLGEKTATNALQRDHFVSALPKSQFPKVGPLVRKAFLSRFHSLNL